MEVRKLGGREYRLRYAAVRMLLARGAESGLSYEDRDSIAQAAKCERDEKPSFDNAAAT